MTPTLQMRKPGPKVSQRSAGDPEAELWQFVLSTLPFNHLPMSLTPKPREILIDL